MALVKWDPFRDVAQLQNRINRIFEESFGRTSETNDDMGLRAWRPAVDIYESAGGIVLAVELPGVSKENVSVEVKDDVLTLKGERLPNPAVKEDDYGYFYLFGFNTPAHGGKTQTSKSNR